MPEHTHIPVSRVSPYPAGGDLPTQYSHSLDPFVALAAAATATTRLKVGTGVCLVVERDPITLAKEVASARLHLGGPVPLRRSAAGWNREEMADHGTDPVDPLGAHGRAGGGHEGHLDARRGRVPRPLRRLRPASGSGPSRSSSPTRPILLGGAGARALEAVIAYADEWTPIYGRPEPTSRHAGRASAGGRPRPAGPRSRCRCSRPRPTRPIWPPCAELGVSWVSPSPGPTRRLLP